MKNGHYQYLKLSDGSEFTGKMTIVLENGGARVYGKGFTGPSKLLLQALDPRCLPKEFDSNKEIITTPDSAYIEFYVGIGQVVFAAPTPR